MMDEPTTTVELVDDDLRGLEFGAKARALRPRERRFAWLMASGVCENATEAARKAGYPDPGSHSSSIRVQACNLMRRPAIQEAIREIASAEFTALLLPTIKATRRLLTDVRHKDHAKVVQSMLSRLGFGERASVDVNVSGEIAVDHTTAAVVDLRRLKAIGVSREKLLEVFGFSGLDRYERMLAERDARAPRVIEHKPDEAPGSIDTHHSPMDAS
jgi:phage terminase small subunit